MVRIKHSPIEYTNVVKRRYPPFIVSLMSKGTTQKQYMNKLANLDFYQEDFIIIEHDWYYLIKDIKNASDLFFEYITEPNRFNEIKIKLKKYEEKLIKSSYQNIKEYSEAFANYIPSLIYLWAFESKIENTIIKELKRQLNDKEINELMDKLNIPLLDNFNRKERLDLLQTNNIKEHVKKYEWILSRYGNIIQYTETQARERLKKLREENFLEKYNNQKAEIKSAVDYAKRILKKKSILIDILQFLLFYRTQRTDILNKSFYYFSEILKKEAERLGITYEEILFCTINEIMKKKIPTKDTIKKRSIDVVMYAANGELTCIVGKEKEDIKNAFSKKIKNNFVKGITAQEGKIIGTAKIINDNKDFNKIKDGDILITHMTTPIMLPIMEKSSGFITDEGGITSHAAILSREMNKPCIIGTKFATKIFKDGDLIELDAYKGIARKINDIIKNETIT